MAVKSTITSGGDGSSTPVNHSRADSTVYRRELCSGTVGINPGQPFYLQSNSHPLSSRFESASIRTTPHYDWGTGTAVNKPLDVLEHAKSQMGSIHQEAVTNARHTVPEKMPSWMMAAPAAQSPTPRKSKTGKGNGNGNGKGKGK